MKMAENSALFLILGLLGLSLFHLISCLLNLDRYGLLHFNIDRKL